MHTFNFYFPNVFQFDLRGMTLETLPIIAKGILALGSPMLYVLSMVHARNFNIHVVDSKNLSSHQQHQGGGRVDGHADGFWTTQAGFGQSVN